jgi:outer membrane lipoprotein-sorting protein
MKQLSVLPLLCRLLARGLCVVLLGLPAVSLAATLDLAQLMQSLAQSHGGRASFVEKKYLNILDRPVESTGELLYLAPSHLEKRTLTPKPENMILDGQQLTIVRGKQKHTLRLQDYPQVATLVESIRATLAGDRKALERQYRLELAGSQEHWSLQLIPTDAAMVALVQRIRIAGSRDQVSSIEMVQKDGDRSVMTITKVQTP